MLTIRLNIPRDFAIIYGILQWVLPTHRHQSSLGQGCISQPIPSKHQHLLLRRPTIPQQQQRVNEQIRLTPVRVVDQDGNMLGEMATKDALTMAREVGLDLVEVGSNARPPVCRIMDYGKVQYEKKKKANTKTHRTQLKQIRLRPKIGDHDLEVKVNRARKFLEKHDKVKINVLFRGRENAHRDLGREMLDEIINTLEDIASVEKPPGMEGRMMSAVLAPR